MSYDNFGPEVRKLGSEVDSLGYSVSSLRDQVSEVKESLDDLEREGLPQQIRVLRDDLEETTESVSRLDSQLDEQSEEIDENARLLKKLAARVQWLERHVRQTSGTESVNLDDTSTDTMKLTRTVQAGRAAEAGLTPDWRRTVLQQSIERHRRAVLERTQLHQAVISACQVLASTQPQQPEHTAAAESFRSAVPRAREASRSLPKLKADAVEAQRELANMESSREAAAPMIDAGQKANKRLQWKMRGRLTDALTSEAMLPTWFITILGPLPPAQNTEQWMSTAVEVLAYRATYGITDPVVALGAEPDQHAASTQRSTWFRELTTALRRWDQ